MERWGDVMHKLRKTTKEKELTKKDEKRKREAGHKKIKR